MGRKPERYKKELAKVEPELKEKSNMGAVESDDGEKRDVMDLESDKAQFQEWREQYPPEFQKPSAVSDEVLHQSNKDLQAKLDLEGKGARLEFFDDREHPDDDVLGISVIDDRRGFLQVIFTIHGNCGMKNISWSTLKPPQVVLKLKKLIREYHKGGDDKRMKGIFNALLNVFKELNWTT